MKMTEKHQPPLYLEIFWLGSSLTEVSKLLYPSRLKFLDFFYSIPDYKS